MRFGADETDVVDRTTAGWLKRASVSGTAFRRVVGDPGVGGRAKFSYQSLSHLVVLPLGDGVLGIDPVGRRTLWQRDLSGAGKEGAPEPKAVSFRPRDGAVQVSYAGGWSGRLGVALPLGPAGVCVAGREGLLCLDPLTGRTRWLRSDVKPGAHVFGDAQTVFAVETAAGGSASSTRAFRVADGRSVKVPDFRKEYDRRVRVLDGRLVVSEKGAKGEVILSLYDPRTGRSPWRQRYRARSIVLSAVDTGLAGVVAPDGTVHVTDPRTGKRVLGAKVDPGHLKGAREVYLLADRKQIYLAVNRAPDKGVTPEGGGVESLFGRGTGLRWLPVNGEVYSFDRATGALRWRDERTWQTLALERFEDLPVLLFTARRGRNQLASPPSPFTGIEGACGAVSGFVDRLKISPRWYHGIHGDCGPVSDFRYGMLDVAPKREKIKPPRTREKRKPPREREQVRPPVLQAFDKRTGKLVYDDQAVPDDMRFYALEVRPAEGAVHLIGKGLEVRFELVPRP